MSSYLLRAFFHRHIRGSTPHIVVPLRTLVNWQHYVGWSPANTALAIGASPHLSLRDVTTGETLRHWQGGSQMAWSPDGSALLTHCLPDVQRLAEWTFEIRDAHTGELRCSYDRWCGSHVYALAWSPDGTRIAHCTTQNPEGLGHIHVWDARSGSRLFEYQGHDSPIQVLAWSPDSAFLLSCGFRGNIHLWQSADGTPVRQLTPQEIWGNVSGTSRVQTVKHAIASIRASSSTPFLNFWEAFIQECMTDPRYLGLLLSGAWSPDGHHLAMIEGDMVLVLNWHTGKQERTYGGHLRDKPYLVPPKTAYGPASLSWSPNSQRIASIDVRGRVHIWPISVPFPWLPWPKGVVTEWKE
jgi:WD40 repeat protein